MKSFRKLLKKPEVKEKKYSTAIIKNVIVSDKLKLKSGVQIYLVVVLRFIAVSNSGYDVFLKLELLAKTKKNNDVKLLASNFISLKNENAFSIIPKKAGGPYLRDILEIISLPHSILNLNYLLQEKVAQKIAEDGVLSINLANGLLANIFFDKVTSFRGKTKILFEFKIKGVEKPFKTRKSLEPYKDVIGCIK